jgi:hypothetical protein
MRCHVLLALLLALGAIPARAVRRPRILRPRSPRRPLSPGKSPFGPDPPPFLSVDRLLFSVSLSLSPQTPTNQRTRQDPSGTDCIGCTLAVALVEQRAAVLNATVDADFLELFCDVLPKALLLLLS